MPRLYLPPFAPRPFTYAVRRHAHSDPEGEVAFEGTFVGESRAQPLPTFVRTVAGPPTPMSFRLSASATVTFTGERHLHALVAHECAGASPYSSLCLTARARQFSCFMVVLGRMGPGQTLLPKHAVILKNKDDLTIPIELEQLPSAREFKDAIASLSPEQQRFAKAYRSMQLEGAVFGVLVIQLKPALEAVLGLPPDALTKEIELTQQLLRLFIEFQIPSGLLSYDGDPSASARDKISAVGAHVAAILRMVDAEQSAEIDRAAKSTLYRAGGVPPPRMAQTGVDEDSDDEEESACQLQCVGMGMGEECVASAACLAASNAPVKPFACKKSMKKGAALARRGCSAPRSECCNCAMPPGCASFGGGGALPPPPPPPAAPLAPPPLPVPGPVPAAPRQPEMPQQSHLVTPAAAETSLTALQDGAASPAAATEGGAADLDYTRVPSELDARLEAQDTDAEMRPTNINVGSVWTLKAQAALLAKPTTKPMLPAAQEGAQQQAFDLLNALTRSGALPIADCSLHVMVAATHCFARSLMDTAIIDNINPIEKLERSSLIVASVVHSRHAEELICPEQRTRVATYSAPLLLSDSRPADGVA